MRQVKGSLEIASIHTDIAEATDRVKRVEAALVRAGAMPRGPASAAAAGGAAQTSAIAIDPDVATARLLKTAAEAPHRREKPRR